jgi:Domain of unknown function (DUF4416)
VLKVSTPTECLLFASFLYRSDLHQESELRKIWQSHYGEFFSLVPQFNPLNDYYSQEMGHGELLKRFFLISSQTFKREILLASKLEALKWENSFAQEFKRSVNIDTGSISLENFLLATTKNYSHRVFLAEGIFADLTYEFNQGKFCELPWTYPDYRDPEKLEFITWARSYLLTKLQT